MSPDGPTITGRIWAGVLVIDPTEIVAILDGRPGDLTIVLRGDKPNIVLAGDTAARFWAWATSGRREYPMPEDAPTQ